MLLLKQTSESVKVLSMSSRGCNANHRFLICYKKNNKEGIDLILITEMIVLIKISSHIN